LLRYVVVDVPLLDILRLFF